MKYFYINSEFIKEDKVKGFQSPLTSFVEIPVLSFSNQAKVKIGTIDLVKSNEYYMPIQLGNIILRNSCVFKENVGFLPGSGNYGFHNFIRTNLQLIFVERQYNPIKYITTVHENPLTFA